MLDDNKSACFEGLLDSGLTIIKSTSHIRIKGNKRWTQEVGS